MKAEEVRLRDSEKLRYKHKKIKDKVREEINLKV